MRSWPSSLGAWALGFIFWPGSPRFIDPDAAAPIVDALPPLVVPVGVFVDQPIEYVNDVATQSAIGRGAAARTSEDYLRNVAARTIKATSLDMCTSEWLAIWIPRVCVLLDAADPVRRGGTGRTIDWDRAATVARTRPTMLAGGITPANIATAVSACPAVRRRRIVGRRTGARHQGPGSPARAV